MDKSLGDCDYACGHGCELMECPFCGGEASLKKKRESGASMWRASCDGCGVGTAFHDNLEGVLSTWNRRLMLNNLQKAAVSFVNALHNCALDARAALESFCGAQAEWTEGWGGRKEEPRP